MLIKTSSWALFKYNKPYFLGLFDQFISIMPATKTMIPIAG